jgi:leader peptidase (prepilin peptidase) / N-methyltransferase
VADLSATGALVGLAVGIATVPITVRLIAAPPVSRSESDLSPIRPIKAPWQPAALTVAACVLTGLRVGPHWDLPSMLVFTVGMAVLAMTDAYWRVLPKRVVYLTWVAGLLGLVLAAAIEDRWSSFATAGGAGVILFVLLAGLHLLAPPSLAFGDARMVGPVGSCLGWWGVPAVLVGFVGSFVLAAMTSLVLLVAGRLQRGSSVALGAYLAVGTGLTVWIWH